MHADQLVSWSRSALQALRSSSRRVWWTSFVLVALLSGLWGIANPPFAAPDEQAHVIRATALDHGELTGKDPSPALVRELKQLDRNAVHNLVVRGPAVYDVRRVCFAFKPEVSASCLDLGSSDRETDVLTSAGRHPPAYYAVVGVASWIGQPGARTVYLMRFVGALITGALVATAITALRRTAAPRLVAAGLVLAITPMVLFVSSAVTPSAPEIAASIALWVCGLTLVSRAKERVENGLVTAVGVSACVLALSRQLAPLWLALIVLAMVGVASRASLRNLARSRWARLWAAAVVACTFGQVAWDLIMKPFDFKQGGVAPLDVSTSEIVRTSFGEGFFWYRQMIGLFGWLDTPSPALTYILWTVGVGFVFVLAAALSKRRYVIVLLAIVGAVIVVPVILESSAYRDAGGVTWQGRYTLPLAFGIPILASVALASTERARELARPRLLLIVGTVVVIAQMLAFTQNLRRYTVGYFGRVQYWQRPEWSPPLSPLLLTVAFVILVVAFVAWVLVLCHGPNRATDEAPEEVVPKALADVSTGP